MHLYKAIGIHHLEYCMHGGRIPGRTCLKKRQDSNYTHSRACLEINSYEERLKECGLTTLKTGRLRGNKK